MTKTFRKKPFSKALSIVGVLADDADPMVSVMKVDKKARGDLLRFVVLDGIGRPGLLEGPDPTLLAAAYAEVTP